MPGRAGYAGVPWRKKRARQAKGDCFHVSAYVRRYTVPYLRVMKALPPHRRDAPRCEPRWTRDDLEMDPR